MNTDNPSPELFSADDDLFYFESDHLALKGNKDYSEILKTIFLLDSQRTRAINDYDKIVELHKQALEDPILLVQKLKNGESIGLPEVQIIADVPSIHWSKYEVSLPEVGLNFVNNRTSKAENISFAEAENNLAHRLGTHNKPWTTEEQRRLEELLVIYPPEPIEFRRFKKIAAALGSRTVKQVSSRIQKYFLKLYRAGLPIPGRIPKNAERFKKSKLHIHQRFNHYLFKPTTFFPQLDVPVVMNEAEQIPGPSSESGNITNFDSNYLIPNSSQTVTEPKERSKSDLDLQIDILQKLKAEKQKENGSIQSTFRHFGYKCDYCNEEPITGTRWHCETCESESIDFCSDCVISQLYSGNAHPLSHNLEPVRYDDTAASTMYSDSSSESMSGSAFDSSNKNLESSNDESSNSEIQSNVENYDYTNLAMKFDQDEEDEDEGDVDEFGDYPGATKNEDDNFITEYDAGDVFVKQKCMDNENDDLLEDEQNKEEYDFQMEEENEMDNNEGSTESTSVLFSGEHDLSENDLYKSPEENVNIEDVSESFTDTQNISYSYLHANLLLDNNTA